MIDQLKQFLDFMEITVKKMDRFSLKSGSFQSSMGNSSTKAIKRVIELLTRLNPGND